MGTRGPVPKRSEQRRRQNKESKPKKVSAGSAKVTRPPANAKWHPAAKRWYTSLENSGQAKFYEASDWALAWLVAESISRDLKPQVVGIHPETGKAVMATIPMKGASLAAYSKAMTNLLVTEGDRRRAGIELERPPEPSAADQSDDVPQLDDYRRRLGG